MTGISLIICCHNSVSRIEETLQHIQNSKKPECPWEVLLVNNNCTDTTISFAQQIWNNNPIAPLRIIDEPNPGLSHAREKGIQSSSFPIIAFVDDDNHISPTWVKEAHAFMQKHPNCSACGGPIIPKCESPPPPWFEKYQGHYSTYDYYKQEERIEHPLAGAGLVIRKKSIENLYNHGFSCMLSDRKGTLLSSGGDYELCYALLLSGGTLWFNPKLKIQHFIPRERLQWAYLKRLNKGFGAQSITLNIYGQLIQGIERPFSWKRELWQSIPPTISSGIKVTIDILTGKSEGSQNQLLFINQYARLISLLRERDKYDRFFTALRKAPWNKLNPSPSNASS